MAGGSDFIYINNNKSVASTKVRSRRNSRAFPSPKDDGNALNYQTKDKVEATDFIYHYK